MLWGRSFGADHLGLRVRDAPGPPPGKFPRQSANPQVTIAQYRRLPGFWEPKHPRLSHSEVVFGKNTGAIPGDAHLLHVWVFIADHLRRMVVCCQTAS